MNKKFSFDFKFKNVQKMYINDKYRFSFDLHMVIEGKDTLIKQDLIREINEDITIKKFTDIFINGELYLILINNIVKRKKLK